MDSDQINHESLMAMAEQTNELQSQLAAQAAHIALLREAIALADLQYMGCGGGLSPHEIILTMRNILNDALAIQSDDAALREQNARLLENLAKEYAGAYMRPQDLNQRAAELRSGK